MEKILVVGIVVMVGMSVPYNLVLHSKERGAACLDGSPAGMYIHEGTNTGKFLIHFKGGGFCGGETLDATLQSCYKRSSTTLGSTTGWPKQQDMDKDGYLSTLPEVNPIFHDWIKVFVIYCDGATHQGYR